MSFDVGEQSSFSNFPSLHLRHRLFTYVNWRAAHESLRFYYFNCNYITISPIQFIIVSNAPIAIFTSSSSSCVLPKGRSFNASGETQAAVLPKAGLPPQTQEPRLQFQQGFNRCGSFPLLSASPSLSLASEQTLKDLKDPRGTNEEVRRVDLANWALRTTPKFTTRVKYKFHQGF